MIIGGGGAGSDLVRKAWPRGPLAGRQPAAKVLRSSPRPRLRRRATRAQGGPVR